MKRARYATRVFTASSTCLQSSCVRYASSQKQRSATSILESKKGEMTHPRAFYTIVGTTTRCLPCGIHASRRSMRCYATEKDKPRLVLDLSNDKYRELDIRERVAAVMADRNKEKLKIAPKIKMERKISVPPPDSPPEVRAEYFWAKNQREEAITLMKDSMHADPGNYELPEKLADMYLLAGDNEEACDYYTRALEEVDKSDKEEMYYLKRAGEKVEETKEEKDNRRSFLLTKRGESKEHLKKDFRTIEQDYLSAIALNKKCFTAYLRLGYLHLNTGNFNAALRYFTEGEKQSDDKKGSVYVEINHGAGMCFYAQGRFEDAYKAFEHVSGKLAPEHAPSHYRAGECAHRLRKYHEAMHFYDKYLETFEDYYTSVQSEIPSHVQSQAILSDLLMKRGDCALKLYDPDAAIYDFQSVVYLQDNDPKMRAKAFYYLSLCYNKQSDWWKMVDVLNSAIDNYPEFFEAFEQRAFAYDNLRMPNEAKADKDRAEILKRKQMWAQQQQQMQQQQQKGAKWI